MRSLGWPLTQYGYVLIKRRHSDTETAAQGEHHVKNWSYAATSQGTPKIAGK